MSYGIYQRRREELKEADAKAELQEAFKPTVEEVEEVDVPTEEAEPEAAPKGRGGKKSNKE